MLRCSKSKNMYLCKKHFALKTLLLHNSKIIVGGALGCIADLVPPQAQVIVVSSRSVSEWRAQIAEGLPVVEIEDDEAHKTLAAIENIASQLLRLNADRQTFLLGIGGGIVCDITGFAASAFMRGIGFGFVPTTLLAQVDASVGGKNGVNLERYKNILGTFRQPDFVLCIPQTLKTLPQSVFAAGFAEIVKAAMIADPCLFEFLETNASQAARQRREHWAVHCLAHCPTNGDNAGGGNGKGGAAFANPYPASPHRHCDAAVDGGYAARQKKRRQQHTFRFALRNRQMRGAHYAV